MKASTFFLKSLAILAVGCVLVLFPALLLLTLLALAYRKVIHSLAKLIRPDLCQILKPFNHLSCYDDLGENTSFNQVLPFFLEGEMSLKDLRNNIERNCIFYRHPEDGQLMYPELQQSISYFGGYAFWKWDQNFDIENHVHSPAMSVATALPEDLKNLLSMLMTKPWERGRALWECLLMNNYLDSTQSPETLSVFILRIHHCVADGYSILNMLKRIMSGGTDATIPVPRKSPKSLMQKILFPFKGIHDLMLESVLLSSGGPAWRRTGREKTIEFHTVWSKPMSAERIKRFKNRFDVSFQATVKAVVAGSIRKLLQGAGQEIPKHMYTLVPLPVSNHSQGLSLESYMATIKLPVLEPCMLKRARSINQSLKNAANSSAPPLMGVGSFILGHLPLGMLKFMLKQNLPQALSVLSFPGFQNSVEINGHRVLAGGSACGTHRGSIGATVGVVTFCGNITFSLTIDKRVFPHETIVKTWSDIVKAELDALETVEDFVSSEFNTFNV